jgi:hypothetical protein
MAAFDEATISWLTVLVGTIIVSLLSVLLPNRYQQGQKPRSHNGIKLLNECLARHQLVYLTYFLALVMTANFGPELSRWLNHHSQLIDKTSVIKLANRQRRPSNGRIFFEANQHTACTIATPRRMSAQSRMPITLYRTGSFCILRAVARVHTVSNSSGTCLIVDLSATHRNATERPLYCRKKNHRQLNIRMLSTR